MARASVSRHWTEDEVVMADRITDVVALAGDDRVVGSWSVVRGLGLPLNHRSRRLVWDVMPLAVIRSAVRYPGAVLVVGRDHTYWLTRDPILVRRRLVTVVKVMRTKVERAMAEASPLIGDPSLAAAVIRHQIGALEQALDPAIWDAVIAEVEAP